MVDSANDADALIVNDGGVKAYRAYYSFRPRPHVEDQEFIDKCIQHGNYKHEMPKRRAMGGRPGFNGVYAHD